MHIYQLQMVPILKKCLVLIYVKSFETQNERFIICGNNGLTHTLTQFSLANFLEKREQAEQRSMQVVVTLLSLEQHVQCDHSNYDVKR